jgi:glutamyl-tRNA reductase
MIDIAVPGDIAPDVGELEDIYLYSVDDLEEVIKENLASRQEAARQAEEIIEVQVERFMAWTRSLDAVSSIQTYREHADVIGGQEVAKARQMLASGKDPGDVIETLAHNIVNKLAHEPSVNLRQAAAEGQSGLLETVRTLFRLKDDSED